MTDLTQDNVLEYLRELEFSAEVQKETQQIVTVNTLENYEFPTFLRIAQDAERSKSSPSSPSLTRMKQPPILLVCFTS